MSNPIGAPPHVPSTAPFAGNAQAFTNAVYPVAAWYEATYGIPATWLLAINWSESNWGNLPQNAALFGIKGDGPCVSTFEIVGGQQVEQQACFQAYPSVEAAYAGFFQLISTGRYANCWATYQVTGSAYGLLRCIVANGYATDVTWPDHITAMAQTVAGYVAQITGTSGEAGGTGTFAPIASTPVPPTEALPPDVGSAFVPPFPAYIAPVQLPAAAQLRSDGFDNTRAWYNDDIPYLLQYDNYILERLIRS